MKLTSFKNPILLCDYSDPDVCRVFDEKKQQDVFYLTASSFNFVPGLPVLKSYNLLDWALVSYGIEKIDFPWYERPQHGKGVWAPAIRFHDGLFYIFFAMPDEGIFEVHTETPEENGSWSKMNCLWKGKGFIDPCPYWDENGKLFIVHGYAKSRIGFNSKLGILEENKENDSAAKEKSENSRFFPDKIIFDGLKTQPTIEGPKIYKKDGFFYIMAPAGGVTFGWQTALRSKSIFGPYEEKIVLSQGETDINGPHQGALFDDSDGSWYFMHFQDRGIFGRVTWLQKAKWENGWPSIGNNGKPEEFIDENNGESNGKKGGNFESARNKTEKAEIISINEELESKNVISEFQTSGNGFFPKSGFSSENGFFPLWDNPAVKTKKIDSEASSTTFKFDFSFENERFTSKADFSTPKGIIFLGDEYAAMGIEKSESKIRIFYIESETVPPEECGCDKNTEIRREKLLAEKTISPESISNATENSNADSKIDSNDLAPGSISIILKIDFFATKNENFQNAQIFIGNASFQAEICINGKKETWLPEIGNNKIGNSQKPHVFTTKNAHWVGGRIGYF